MTLNPSDNPPTTPKELRDRIHLPSVCKKQPCPFHNPSQHKMRDWPRHIRTDAFKWPLVERICKHGVGHPDPDSASWLTMTKGGDWYAHGCDGCCAKDNLIDLAAYALITATQND